MSEQIFLITTYIVWVIVFLIVPLLLYCRNRNRLPTYFISLAFVLLITYGLKYGLGIPRPEDAAWEMVTPRFPSGHTSMAFTPILFFKSLKYKLSLSLYGIMVAYLRIHFNLHVPVDILVSVSIAVFTSLFFLGFEKNIIQKLSPLIKRILDTKV